MYVEDVNDEVPVFTQRQYNRLGLRETAGIGTSVAVVRATDRDTGTETVQNSDNYQVALSLHGLYLFSVTACLSACLSDTTLSISQKLFFVSPYFVCLPPSFFFKLRKQGDKEIKYEKGCLSPPPLPHLVATGIRGGIQAFL